MVGQAGCWLSLGPRNPGVGDHGARGGQGDQTSTDASYRVYRILTHGILVMVVVFFLFGDRIIWINCLTGFAWRAWLLLYTLPAWVTALRTSATS